MKSEFKLIKIPIDQENHIALWQLNPTQSIPDNLPTTDIFLTHGTFSNRKVLSAMAAFLADKGFRCWIMEWRNHGSSSRIKSHFNFETIALKDINLAFNYLFEEQQVKQLHCITHSGGGICLTMFLIKNPQFCDKIKSMIFFGCQAFGAGTTLKNKLSIRIGKYGSKMLGFIPASMVGSPENESYGLMKQWFDWNISQEFIGEEGFDYKKEMQKIRVPVFSICGGGDHFIAPVEGCQKFLSAFENPKNKLLICSKENGFRENYNHSRVMHSKNASEEIYPLALNWIESC